MTTESQKLKVVKVNSTPADEPPDREEVFIQSVDPKAVPFINRGIYAKPGLFKEGVEMTSEEVDALEARSKKEIADEHPSLLEKEAREREARQTTDTPAAPTLEG